MQYGFNPQLEIIDKKATDWVYGALSIPCITDIPEDEREKYLPQGERQNIGEEKYDCATRGPINILETKFTWLYQNKKLSPDNLKFLEDNDYIQNNRVIFSDRYIALLSGTTVFGNSMIRPLQTIHEKGLIPKAMFPQVERFYEYYDSTLLTQKMRDLGEEFITRFPIYYEQVLAPHYSELLKEDLIVFAGYSWPVPINGIYPRSDEQMNHVFDGIKNPPYIIFDNYEEEAGDFIKQLAPDYNLNDYGYRVFIQEWKGVIKVDNPAKDDELTSIGGVIIKWIKTLYAKLFKRTL